MRIVYVGDNRNRDNFGCRATSTALSQIISKDHEIVARVYGNYTNADLENLFFYKWLPSNLYERLPKKKHWGAIRSALIVFFRFLGLRTRNAMPSYDFVSHDFEKSIMNLKKCLPANEQLRECMLDRYDFDALVVNGEGSFIFAKQPWREALVEAMLMYWALKLNKKVYYLNGMFSADSDGVINIDTINAVKSIFERIDYVGVREMQSYDFAKKYFPNANIHQHPDALFSWNTIINDDFKISNLKYYIGYSAAYDNIYNDGIVPEEYICLSGSSARKIWNNIEYTVQQYTKLVNELKKFGKKIYIVEPCSGDNFLFAVAEKTNTTIIPADTPIVVAAKLLAGAQVYITGRYHPAILASLGGTPCVFMGSNSHKNDSLQDVLMYSEKTNYCEVPGDDEIKRIVEDCKKKMGCVSTRNEIKKRVDSLSQRTEEIRSVIK